jgi:vacuolar-type H+-ATPase subunit E/Vma4
MSTEVQPLLDLMTQEADAQCARIREDAARAAEELRQAAMQEAAKRREEVLAELDRELRALHQRACDRAAAEIHMRLLTAKDAIADELLQQVEKEIEALVSREEFLPILRRLLDELLESGEEGDVVLVPQAYTDTVRAWLQEKHRSFRIEPVAFLRDGVALQDAAQSYRVTNTLSQRFRAMENHLRKFCQQQLSNGTVSPQPRTESK